MPRKDSWYSEDSNPTAASEKEFIAEYQIVGKSANGAEVVGVLVQRHLRCLGGRRCGGRVYRWHMNDRRGARRYRYRGRRGGLSGM